MQGDGSGLTYIFLVFAGLMLLLSAGVILFVVIYQRRVMLQQMRMQEIEAEYQKELLSATLQTQEKERLRIAKDLHDEIGAMLSAVKMNVNLIDKRLKKQGATEIGIEDSREVIDAAIKNVRRISHDLMPPSLEKLGLTAALKEFFEKTEVMTGVDTRFSCTETPQRLDAQLELALFRIVQESVNNALKHAQASLIEASLGIDPTRIHLQIKDNGSGFDVPAAQAKSGLGLKSLESRTAMIGGKLQINSTPGKGTQITLTLPHVTK